MDHNTTASLHHLLLLLLLAPVEHGFSSSSRCSGRMVQMMTGEVQRQAGWASLQPMRHSQQLQLLLLRVAVVATALDCSSSRREQRSSIGRHMGSTPLQR